MVQRSKNIAALQMTIARKNDMHKGKQKKFKIKVNNKINSTQMSSDLSTQRLPKGQWNHYLQHPRKGWSVLPSGRIRPSRVLNEPSVIASGEYLMRSVTCIFDK